MAHGKNCDKAENVKRAWDTLSEILAQEKYLTAIPGCARAYEFDTGNILFFFPMKYLEIMEEKRRREFIDEIKKAWRDANFEIVEERDI